MSRLPIPGGDTGNWGTILNDYLAQSHSNDGSLKDNSIAESKLDTAARAKLNATAGPVGATGAQGPAGSVGATGATGPAGSIGPQGATGASGTTGSSGATGATGPQGDPATNLVTSVAGKQGVVALVKGDVGLGKVENTSDAIKPVSRTAET